MSLGSKYGNISKSYRLLEKVKGHKVITIKTKERKARVMNNALKLYNYFNFYEETYDESDLDEKEGRNTEQFKIVDNELPELLKSRNDLYKAKRLIDDIRIDINKARVSKDDKNIFYGLNRLITDISNNRVNKENALEILKNRMSDLR